MPGFEVIGPEERAAVDELFRANNGVLFAHGYADRRNGQYRVRELEHLSASIFDVRHVQATASGSAALWCAMRALGVQHGDEVITQAFTFVATVEAALMCAARPVIVDVDETLNMDPDALEAAITPRTQLIVPVHMAGVAARMDRIEEIARRHGIAILEDAAQAVGATYCGRQLGTIGDAGIFSLDFNKIVTSGEGGLLVTDRDDVYRRARGSHDHGHAYDDSLPRGQDPHEDWGFNFRMTELQAAVATVQLGKLANIVETQRRHKTSLESEIVRAGLPVRFREVPEGCVDNGDTVFIFTETVDEADRAVKALYEAGIGTKNVPDALDWHFAGRWDHIFGTEQDQPLSELFTVTAAILGRTVSIPVWVDPPVGWLEGALRALLEALGR